MDPTTEERPESTIDQAKRDYDKNAAASSACLREAARYPRTEEATPVALRAAGQTYAALAQAAAARLQAEHLEQLTTTALGLKAGVTALKRAADQLVAAFTVAAPHVIAVFSTVAEQIARQADAAEAILAVNQQLAAGLTAPPVVSLGDVTCGARGPVGGFTCILPPHDAEVRHEDRTGGSWSAGPPAPFAWHGDVWMVGDKAPGVAESPGEARGVPLPLGEPVSPASGQLGGPDDPSAPEVRP